jgi:hypothetical protein
MQPATAGRAERRLRARLKDAIHVGIDGVVRRVGRVNIRAELAATTLGHQRKSFFVKHLAWCSGRRLSLYSGNGVCPGSV